MTYKNQLINGLKQGFLFYAFSTILIAIQFGFYIVGSPVLDYMDFEGWVFFAASCVSHASQFALLGSPDISRGNFFDSTEKFIPLHHEQSRTIIIGTVDTAIRDTFKF